MKTDRNRLNEQKKHTYHIQRNMKLQRVSVKLSDTRFFRTPPFIWGKFEPPFLGRFRKLIIPLYEGVGLDLYL